MPALGQLACYVQGPCTWPLMEYGTVYGDRKVATYVCIPKKPTPFTIRFMTTGYIAPGLSVWVYVDGVRQCNRNWLDFYPSGRYQTHRPESNEIATTLQQGEKGLQDGTFLARSWYFGKVNKDVRDRPDPRVDKERIGTIEIVVLRCNDDPDDFTCTPRTQGTAKVTTSNLTKTQTQNPRAQKPRSNKHVTFACEEDNQGELSGLFDGTRDSASVDHTAFWLSQMDGIQDSLPIQDRDRASGPAAKRWAGGPVRRSQPYGARAGAQSLGRIFWEEEPTMPTRRIKVESDRHAQQIGESSNNNHHSRYQGLHDVTCTHCAGNHKSNSTNMLTEPYQDEDLPKVPGHWVADGKHSKSLEHRHPGRHRLSTTQQSSPYTANLSPLQVPHNIDARFRRRYCDDCGGYHLVRESGPAGAGGYDNVDYEYAHGTTFIDHDEESSPYLSTYSEEDDGIECSCSECLYLDHEAAEGSSDRPESWCSECHESDIQSEAECSCCNFTKEGNESSDRYSAGPAYSYGSENHDRSGLRHVYHNRFDRNHGHSDDHTNSDDHTTSHEYDWGYPMLDGNASKEAGSATRGTGRSDHRHSRMRYDYVHVCECCGHICSHRPANRLPMKDKASSKHFEHSKQDLHMSERRHRGKQAEATKKMSDDHTGHQAKFSKNCDCGRGHEGTVRHNKNPKSSVIKDKEPQWKRSRSTPEKKHKHGIAEKEGDKRHAKHSHKSASSKLPDGRTSRKSKSTRDQCKCRLESSDASTEKSSAGNADAVGTWDEGGNEAENWAESAGRDNDAPVAWEDNDGKAKASNLNWDDSKSSNASHESKGKAPANTAEHGWDDQAEWDDQRDESLALDQDTLLSAAALKKKARSAHVYVAPEEPPLRVPRSVADEKDLDHQVVAGKGALYSHKLRSPRYTDTMENPYATFKFHYRVREAVDRILGIDATDKHFSLGEAIRAIRKSNMPPAYVRWLLSQRKEIDLDTDSAIDQNEKWETSKPGGDGPGSSKW